MLVRKNTCGKLSSPFSFPFFFLLFSSYSFCFCSEKDKRPVLLSTVSVKASVMTLKKMVQKFFVVDFITFISDFKTFCMISDRTVRRRYRRAAGIPDCRLYNLGETPEPGIWTPESSHTEYSGF
jgi:hypothetical protein